MPSAVRHINLPAIAATGLLLALQISGSSFSHAAIENANDFLVVDCLLPGQVRKLGSQMTYVTARRAIRTSAVDCGIRGGEHVAYDRADYRTALKVWLPKAKEGDPESMTNVGEIYEKGLGLSPDYEVAAYWYAKAAGQDFTRAQINLGYLYEMGMGVERNPRKALDWYRKASGVDAAIDLTPSSVPSSGDTQANSELVSKLEQELAQLQSESTQLRSDLDHAHTVLAKSAQNEQASPAIQPPRIVVKPDPRTAHELADVRTTLAQREREVAELDALLLKTKLQLANTQQTLSHQQREVAEQHNTIQQTLSSSEAKQAEVDMLGAQLRET
jgi:flagellar biosynthesis chaperone FliJ